ncbi:CTP synthase ura7, partial [Tilletia horrida]
MKVPYATEEEQILCALEAAHAEAAQTKRKPNFSQLAKKWGVDRRKLSRRYEGKHSKITRPAANKKLTKEQEQSLLDYVE